MNRLRRIASVLRAAWKGESHCWLSPADREKAAIELDDESLAKWTRWALATAASYYEGEAQRRKRSLMEVVATHGVIALALITLRAKGTHATFAVDGVTFKGEPKGDWQVTIERKEPQE